MSQSNVPTAPNLDILTEVVTDTGAAAPSATTQMQAILGELDKAAAQSALIIGSAGHSPLAERRATTTKKKAKPSDAASSWSPVSVALNAGIVSVGIEVLSREAIWSEFNLPPLYKLQVRLGLIK
jgi:gamma-glutamyl:cysteine ligase YbdK (ATP-grasp superfamily)